ncbi:HAMP domain-containing histidine kinase [Bacillus sp. FJAT-29790]|uniref:sensor histidine kinase n=1 Tax=Bacillus sp. FJAT-29790 TaxID=1895002 RepID=UPI001C24108A|nr:HAMP domain-containing sensor histidine kinase [Bacillus sp. FJAT-29790]MBU8881325.1 HAMP domain-containing histidine kinase [Bacillus sp. FJAT-29790]
MFTTLRNRFLLLNMSMISLLMIAAFTFIYVSTYNKIQIENESKLQSISSRPGGVSLSLPDPKGHHTIRQEKLIMGIPAEYSLSFTILVNPLGNVLRIVSYIDMTEDTYIKAAELAWQNKKNHAVIKLEGKQWLYKITPLTGSFIIRENGQKTIINTPGTNYQMAFLDVTDSAKTLSELLMTFLVVGIGMLFIIFAICLYFANRAIKPIAEAWDKQKQFIADASHEFKTPLAIINANADVLIEHQEDKIKHQRKWLKYIKIETDRMGKLVNHLLELAKTEDTSLKIEATPFNMSDVVNDVIVMMEAVAFEKGITLAHSVESNMIYKGDSEKWKQVIMILLDNAIKYTDEQHHIDIVLKKSKNRTLFSIRNSGKGIPKEMLAKVFDRFYRSDPARTQDSGGYGLGLPIAKAIVERMGGKIYAESIEHESTTFTIIF